MVFNGSVRVHKVCKLLRENAARAERRAAEAPASPAARATRATRVAPEARTPARPAPSLSEAKAAATDLQKALAAQGFPSSCSEVTLLVGNFAKFFSNLVNCYLQLLKFDK